MRAGYGVGRVWLGGYTGWVIRVLPGTHRPREEGSITSEAGPEGPAGAWSGGLWSLGACPCVRRRGRLLGPPWHCQGPLPAVAVPGPLECRLWPNKARFHDISCKVSQKARVSSKSVEKACHSPYIQNGLEKSPLDFLRFLFSSAFSHKELMGCF